MFIKASDAKSWSLCHRRAWLDNFPPLGVEAGEVDPFEQMIIEKGNLLEQKYLQLFQSKHQVVEALPYASARAAAAGLRLLPDRPVAHGERGKYRQASLSVSLSSAS